MKNLATLYKELSAEDQASYKRRAEELREEYKIKKQQFKYAFHCDYLLNESV